MTAYLLRRRDPAPVGQALAHAESEQRECNRREDQLAESADVPEVRQVVPAAEEPTEKDEAAEAVRNRGAGGDRPSHLGDRRREPQKRRQPEERRASQLREESRVETGKLERVVQPVPAAEEEQKAEQEMYDPIELEHPARPLEAHLATLTLSGDRGRSGSVRDL